MKTHVRKWSRGNAGNGLKGRSRCRTNNYRQDEFNKTTDELKASYADMDQRGHFLLNMGHWSST